MTSKSLLQLFSSLVVCLAIHTTNAAAPVLLVIADRSDFHYQEYADTRQSIEEAGIKVHVAATTTQRSIPHPNTGQPAGTDGGVMPDIALARVKAEHYSAIVFVGGWGSSMYQYAFNDPALDGTTDNFYLHRPYNGDENLYDGRISKTKIIVNHLINEFLAWARVDGASPLVGTNVVVPFIGSPAAFYLGRYYGNYALSQYEQVIDNGGLANPVSGQEGDPTTVADDVIVDGRIITAENYDSAAYFGQVIAAEVIGNFPATSLRK